MTVPPTCDAQAAATFLRALAHPMRLTILCRLLDGACAVADFESQLGLKQPSLSQQLGLLREAGFVAARREAKSFIYVLADDRVRTVIGALNEVFGAHPGTAAPPAPAGLTNRLSLGLRGGVPRQTAQPNGEQGKFAIAGHSRPKSRFDA
jgi:DNA-binding transcriptional ArsR family regulator